MIFSSLLFLFRFLPAVLVLYYLHRARCAIWYCFCAAWYFMRGENRSILF